MNRRVTSGYDINDPAKIQGRDEIRPGDRNLASIRLERALAAISETRGRLLLLGAGAGRYARALARSRPDLRIVAGDLSEIAIREAITLDGGADYLVMDAESLPFADLTFDSIVFFDLLEHVPHPDCMLVECSRALKPEGVLHFFVPLEDEPRTLYRALRRDRPIPIHRWKLEHVGHIQRFARDGVLELTRRSGLTITNVSHSFHLIGQAHDIVDYWQRDRRTGGSGTVPLWAVRAIARGIFVATWRLAYVEDRLITGSMLASGLHLTARKR